MPVRVRAACVLVCRKFGHGAREEHPGLLRDGEVRAVRTVPLGDDVPATLGATPLLLAQKLVNVALQWSFMRFIRFMRFTGGF